MKDITYTVFDTDRNLESEAKQHNLRRIYLSVEKINNINVVKLTKNPKNILCCVTNQEKENPLEYFKCELHEVVKNEEVQIEDTKRKKQGTLFAFMKK